MKVSCALGQPQVTRIAETRIRIENTAVTRRLTRAAPGGRSPIRAGPLAPREEGGPSGEERLGQGRGVGRAAEGRRAPVLSKLSNRRPSAKSGRPLPRPSPDHWYGTRPRPCHSEAQGCRGAPQSRTEPTRHFRVKVRVSVFQRGPRRAPMRKVGPAAPPVRDWTLRGGGGPCARALEGLGRTKGPSRAPLQGA